MKFTNTILTLAMVLGALGAAIPNVSKRDPLVVRNEDETLGGERK